MESELKEIFEKITVHHEIPVRLSNRCEASVYYHVEDLTPEDVEFATQYVAERIMKVCSPSLPDILVQLSGSYTGMTSVLSEELAVPGEHLEIIKVSQLDNIHDGGTVKGGKLRGRKVVLVTDVITTARSCIEAHTRVTMMGGQVLCWAALIDRTFGPGPVPVVTAFTGAPVKLLETNF